MYITILEMQKRVDFTGSLWVSSWSTWKPRPCQCCC